jgi:hypothetical protein
MVSLQRLHHGFHQRAAGAFSLARLVVGRAIAVNAVAPRVCLRTMSVSNSVEDAIARGDVEALATALGPEFANLD